MSVVGRVTIIVNGVLQESMPGATLKIGGVNAEPITSDQGVTHPKETFVHSLVSAEFLSTPGLDLTALRNLRDAEIKFVPNVGPAYTVPNAFSHNAGDWEYKETSTACEFAGGEAKPA